LFLSEGIAAGVAFSTPPSKIDILSLLIGDIANQTLMGLQILDIRKFEMPFRTSRTAGYFSFGWC
jgi:hypothetical protein